MTDIAEQRATAAKAMSPPLGDTWIDRWDRFWYAPEPIEWVVRIRGVLCLLALTYFLSAWADAEFWYGTDGVQSSPRVASFLISAGLQGEARWYVSPLFFFEGVTWFRGYLVAGMLLAAAVFLGKGGRLAGLLLWAWVVGLSNRALFLAGMAETPLSIGLFAVAIAPAAPAWHRSPPGVESRCWTAGLARKLMAVPVTLLAVATTASMLAGPVWWNGLGAFALAAPREDRTIDWTQGALSNPLVHDLLTHLLVIGLPLGVAFAWKRRSIFPGRVLVWGWCAAVALLGSLWLYAAAVAALAAALGPRNDPR